MTCKSGIIDIATKAHWQCHSLFGAVLVSWQVKSTQTLSHNDWFLHLSKCRAGIQLARQRVLLRDYNIF